MLGEVFAMNPGYMVQGNSGDWRGERAHGGGMVLDWGVHILDQALLMINERLRRSMPL